MKNRPLHLLPFYALHRRLFSFKHQVSKFKLRTEIVSILTQVSDAPPKFLIFLNDPALMKSQYLNYLQNQIRKRYRYVGVPLQFSLRRRSSR